MASHTRLVMNTTIRTYLRSLTQIENVGTKREQFVAIYSHYERYLSYSLSSMNSSAISRTITFPLKGYY
jgi:hypothetical protein